MNELKQTSTQFALGGIAGGIGVTTVYPIDLIKTNIQESRVNLSIRQCLKRVVRQNGVFGLFNGLKPQLLGVAPEKAIKLAINDLAKRTYSQYPHIKHNFELPADIASGGLAGASQVIVTNPLEIVKIRLQIQAATIADSAKQVSAFQIARSLGLKGLYKGSRACLMRDIPFSMIYFPTYSRIKRCFSDDSRNSKITPIQLLASGTGAGAIAAITTTPADVVKTRLQAHRSPFHSISQCFKWTIHNEGISGLFRGVVPRTLRSAPQFGVTLFVYEMLQEYN